VLENLPEKEDAAGLRELGDAVDCHLADMLQQLTAVNSAKPSERVAVRQGESGAVPQALAFLGILLLCPPDAVVQSERAAGLDFKLEG